MVWMKERHIEYCMHSYFTLNCTQTNHDAQMTFLAISKLVDSVITENSDLIPFGCPRGVNDSSRLVPDRNLQLKSFKPESERKRLDLPVQKNLLTNYFCFASLEEKRNFKAPRVSHKHSSLVANSSTSPDKHVTLEDASCKIDTLLSTSLESKNTNNIEENVFISELSENAESPNPGKEARFDETRSPNRVLPQEPDRPKHRPSPALPEHNYSTRARAAKSKTITDSKKSIVRSRYFQKKQVDTNDQEDKQAKFCCKDDNTIRFPESSNPDSYGNNYFKGMVSKRKNSSLEYDEPENVNPQQIYMDASHDDTGHYSNVAEKSMERFVSVISSFRFSSPGSRASGLRAPLKYAPNTCINRSSAAVDINQFAYIPKN
ncbi:5'-3' exonuclease family protein isoform 1 [Hibiscus syriacus]|uniref:5'-3' exonuclease family protein isoform 1 n=1 Tax=Hibiscus syriacus TaxID=106335 RepID=A0A6A3C5X0_HIBSY|nr:5'-3' exonuclease family protein isoform 1 [Hibiscus syriacus]